MPVRHLELADFPAAKETRQLFARDQLTGNVVFMPEGAADDFRDGCREGRFSCPIEGCEAPLYEAVGRRDGRIRHHFRHKLPRAGAHAPESWLHEMAKSVLGQQLQDRYPHAEVFIDTKAVDGGQRPDVLVEMGGHRIAFEVQYAALTVEDWRRRHAGYQANGIHDVWLFGNRPPHFRRHRHEPQRWLLQLSDLLWAVHRDGLPVRFIGPDALAVATTLVEATSGRPYRYKPYELALDPLEACEIVDGRFVVPSDELEHRALAERLEQQAREAEEHRLREAEWERRERRREAERQRLAVAEKRRAEYRTRKQREDEQAWAAAEPAFLRAVGLTTTPRIIDAELPADRGIWMHPARWHAEIYWQWIHGRVGSSFSFRQAGRRYYVRQGDRNKLGATRALTGYLWELKRRGFVDFEAVGYHIATPIRVVADLADPPREKVITPGWELWVVEQDGRRLLVAHDGEIAGDFPSAQAPAPAEPEPARQDRGLRTSAT